jgi:hypothetical protein
MWNIHHTLVNTRIFGKQLNIGLLVNNRLYGDIKVWVGRYGFSMLARPMNGTWPLAGGIHYSPSVTGTGSVLSVTLWDMGWAK